MRNSSTLPAPRWPAEPVDPGIAWVDYDVRADEFLVFFGGKSVPSMSDPLDAPGFAHVAVMFGLGADNESTDEIVGVQVIPMLLGAVQERPEWAVLAWAALAGEYGAELLKERLPGFLEDVADAVRRFWTPAPTMEAQLASLGSASRTMLAANQVKTA